jgi:sugar (pentulose or hexulose) kinase
MSPDGEMLGKMYCYRDHRLDNMVDQVKQCIDARRMYTVTGIHFQPFNISNQLHWLVKNRPDLVQPGCFFLPVPSLFPYYLGGVREVDSTWASATQLMDARAREWSGEILEKLGIPLELLPPIARPGTLVGRLHAPLAESIGINAAPIAAVASHDTASAFAAAPVDDPAKSLIISSGTWSLVGKLVPEPITSDAALEANLSNEGGVNNIRLLKNCMGTWLVQELIRGWAVADGRKPAWDELNRLTEAAPQFAALIDPDDPGFFNPPDMEAAIAGFCERTGQPAPPDRGTFLRVVYESLALKYRFVNEQICRASDTETSNLHIVGGGCRNELLNQCAANATGLPVQAGPEEATAAGNLMMQAVALGLLGSIQDAQPIIREAFPIRTYTPQDSETWNAAYDRFLKIVNG